jgi:hypothetical protein
VKWCLRVTLICACAVVDGVALGQALPAAGATQDLHLSPTQRIAPPNAGSTDSLDAEARRRLRLSRLRREQVAQNSLYLQTLLASPGLEIDQTVTEAAAEPALATPKQPQPRRGEHRALAHHRSTTADGRRAVGPRLPRTASPVLPVAAE